MTIRTRFAPSPTGLLHVGGVRTALFSWLYAKRHNGDFVLRIEDTDRERSTQESVDAILDGMNWLGLDSDEGPYYQTKRYDRYEEVIEQLLAEGKAYHCYCSKERLEELREKQLANKEKPRYDGCCRDKNLPDRDQDSVVRFKNPLDGDVYFQDQVYGDITISNQELDDLIIRRSDGNPTYNFTVVIDDWDMQISHVIRGDDHINNTPRQINIFKALGASVPIFAHLPMILGDDGKRLSKRHGAVGVMEFQRMGILPAALLNYLVRLGWSHGDQEIFSLEEMQQLFGLESVSRGVSSFNYEKLNWLNQHYQKNLSFELVGPELHWHFKNQKVNPENGPDLQTLLELQAERCDNLAEVVEKSLYFYQDEISYDEQAVKKNLRPVVMEPLKMIRHKLEELPSWQHEAMHQVVIETAEHFELKMGKVAQPLRVAVTGNTMSPSIDTTLFLIGKERVLKRLDKALAMIAERMEKSA